MEKEFVPYGLGLKLKALGFDEPCFFAFDNCSTPMRCSDLRTNEQKFNGVNYNSSSYTSQPTFSQAFRWFREKHNLHCAVNTHTSSTNQLTYICSLEFGKKLTYEEAELACLDKLIELVESKSE